jgi:hypothetical protein
MSSSLMANPVFKDLLASRAAASAALLIRSANQRGAGALRFIVAVSSIVTVMRTPFGWDSADQMPTITFSGLTVASGLPELKSDIRRFFTFQLCLSYLASGHSQGSDARMEIRHCTYRNFQH